MATEQLKNAIAFLPDTYTQIQETLTETSETVSNSICSFFSVVMAGILIFVGITVFAPDFTEASMLERKISNIELGQKFGEPSQVLHQCYECDATCNALTVDMCKNHLDSLYQDELNGSSLSSDSVYCPLTGVYSECSEIINCCQPSAPNLYKLGKIGCDSKPETESCTGLCETRIEIKNGQKRDIKRVCSSKPWGGSTGLSVSGTDVFRGNLGSTEDPVTVICRCQGAKCNDIYNPNDCVSHGLFNTKYSKALIWVIVFLTIFIIWAEIMYRCGVLIEYVQKSKIRGAKKRVNESVKNSMRNVRSSFKGSRRSGRMDLGQQRYSGGETLRQNENVYVSSPDTFQGRNQL